MKVHIGRYPSDYTKEQKVDVRIDKWDTWSMDHTLAYIIAPMLKQLKATKQGIPSNMPALDQCSMYSREESFEFYCREDEAAEKEAERQWDEILDKMIWAFEQYNTDWEDQYHTGESDFVWEDIPGSENKKLGYGPNHTAVFDGDGYAAHHDRIREGFRLFGEHYMSLWD
jgi:hypothetical protein